MSSEIQLFRPRGFLVGLAIGLLGAGLAFALQRVITAVAGYFVILRGKTFNVGDRIVMGGVRGDVIEIVGVLPAQWSLRVCGSVGPVVESLAGLPVARFG